MSRKRYEKECTGADKNRYHVLYFIEHVLPQSYSEYSVKKGSNCIIMANSCVGFRNYVQSSFFGRLAVMVMRSL